MANYWLPLPKVVVTNPEVAIQLREAFGKLYDENNKPIPGQETELGLFLNKIHSSEIGIPEDFTIKQIGIILEGWYETITKAPEFSEPTVTMKGAPESPVSQTTLTPDQLARLMAEERARAVEISKSRIEKKKEVETSIKKQQEIQTAENRKEELKTEKLKEDQTRAEQAVAQAVEKKVAEALQTQKASKEQLLKEALQRKSIDEAKEKIQVQIAKEKSVQESLRGKEIYAKVEISKTVPPPDESTLNFIREAKTHPASFQKDLAENIKAKITPSLSEKLTEEQINVIAEKTAFDTIRAINDFPTQSSANTQSAILGALAKESQLLPKMAGNNDIVQILKKSSEELNYFKDNTRFSKNILSAINKNLATAVFGVGPEGLEVTFSERPIEGYTHKIKLDDFEQGHVGLLNAQSNTLDNIKSFAGDQAHTFLTGQVRNLLDKQIAKLPTDNAVAGFYNSKFGQRILNFAGLGKANPLGQGFLLRMAQQIPGGTAFLEGMGKSVGIDLIAAPTAEVAATAAIESTALVEEAAVAEVGTGIAALGEAAVGVETAVIAEGVAAKTVAGGVLGRAVAAVATKIGATVAAISTAVSTALNFLNGILPGLGLVASAIATWIITKIPWKKIAPILLGAVAGIGAFIVGGLAAGVIVGVGVGVLSAASIGGVTVVGVVGEFIGFLAAAGASLLAVILAPFLILIFVLPIVIALVLFIINAGAYVVPPGATGITTSGPGITSNPGTVTTGTGTYTPPGSVVGNTNPYIDVQKTASPNGSVVSPQLITYTITVTAKIDALTITSFTPDCQAIHQNGTTTICPPEQAFPAPGTVVQPGTPYSFTISINYDSSYQNSLATNSVKVDANSVSGGTVSATGVAQVCFGSCPTNCLDLSDPSWQQDSTSLASLAHVTNATTQLVARYPNYANKFCAAGTIKLCYTTNNPAPAPGCVGGWYAEWFGTGGACNVRFNYCGIKSDNDALFTLAHELTHWIVNDAGGSKYQTDFVGRVWAQGETSLCSYPGTVPSATNLLANAQAESLAEGDGLYVAIPSWGGCIGNYATHYPLHYNFAQTEMFAP